MLPSQPLRTHDLDTLHEQGMSSAQPLTVATELVTAVDQGLIADKDDIGYALLLASDVTAAAGDLPAAIALAERTGLSADEAVELHRVLHRVLDHLDDHAA